MTIPKYQLIFEVGSQLLILELQSPLNYVIDLKTTITLECVHSMYWLR